MTGSDYIDPTNVGSRPKHKGGGKSLYTNEINTCTHSIRYHQPELNA